MIDGPISQAFPVALKVNENVAIEIFTQPLPGFILCQLETTELVLTLMTRLRLKFSELVGSDSETNKARLTA